MKIDLYDGVNERVVDVVRDALQGADEYHTVHTARLARTADLLFKENLKGKMLEIGTSGFIPMVCKHLLPDLEIHGTKLRDVTQPGAGAGNTEFSVGRYKMSVHCYNVDLEYSMIPVNDETFDSVLCCEVLEHMEIDPMFMLSEVNRVLKTGGTLLLTTPNVVSSRGITKMLSGLEPYFFMHYHRSREYHRHNYEYSVPSLTKILKSAGFTAKVWTEDLFEDPLTQAVDALRAAGFTIEDVGDNLIALAKKTSPVIDRYPVGLYV
ncbi:MAG: class I SAM-dependent methyltransferase [Pseudanabaena sp.]|jgi:SAM-dependent methyltransferase